MSEPSSQPTTVEAPVGIGTSWEARHYGMPPAGWRRRWFITIFEAETPAGRRFDLWLLAVIVASVVVVMLDSVGPIAARYGALFNVLEWGFTVTFTAEYIARLVSVKHPWRYARSFFGIIDLLSVLPTYLAYFFPELHTLIDVRVLRLLRVFRILKLSPYIDEYSYLMTALFDSRRKILVFLAAVLMMQITLSTLMYVVEGPANGFTSIPTSIYWGITAMTTVGFGDIVPKTDLGRAIASVMMLLGWGILAVPTGIVTAEMTVGRSARSVRRQPCTACGNERNLPDARYCQACGNRLNGR